MITSPYPTPLSTVLVQARLIAKFRCDPVKKKKKSYPTPTFKLDSIHPHHISQIYYETYHLQSGVSPGGYGFT